MGEMIDDKTHNVIYKNNKTNMTTPISSKAFEEEKEVKIKDNIKNKNHKRKNGQCELLRKNIS